MKEDASPPAAVPVTHLVGEANSRDWLPYLVREPAAVIAFAAASTSIGSLILYLLGCAEFMVFVLTLLLPGVVALGACYLWARSRGKLELRQRIVGGLWAGLVATLLYDVARVPTMLSGLPVFKAISYFGTVLLGLPSPTLGSELAGWSYHVSNGVGFGLMYVLLTPRPVWATALLWGLSLEGLMLLTPYAEVFGYRVSRQFLMLTITAHAVYGLTLWAVLKYWLAGSGFGQALRRPASLLAVSAAAALFGILAVASGFHERFARTLPPSPPDYIGAHLYTTWDVPESDRIVAAWVLQRYVDPQARFYFVTPFASITRGIPFDTPEAKIRRSATRSATENLLTEHGLDKNPALARLGHMTHVYEITPWAAATDEQAYRLHGELTKATGDGPGVRAASALRSGSLWLDHWIANQ